MLTYERLCLPIYSRQRRAQWGVPEDGTIVFAGNGGKGWGTV